MDIPDDKLDAWRKKEEERRLEQLKSDIAALMGSESGRRIAWWLLETSGVYQSSFRDNPLAMAFAEGRRAFGNQFLEWISSICTEHYLLMQQEALNERRERQLRQRHALGG